MLILPPFDLFRPTTVSEAVEALDAPQGECLVISGGTDLLPNLKHGLHSPRRLVSTRRLEELRSVEVHNDGWLRIGAGVTLHQVAQHGLVVERYPGLAIAAESVAGPQHRRMGTIGGNLCLDTRCVYINQTHFWRQSLGFCLKKDGTQCHVVPSGRRCVAAFSADTPGPLIALGAEVELVSPRGHRRIAVGDFFKKDGVANTVRAHDELVTAIFLPAPAGPSSSHYIKLRARRAIDFPTLSVAAAAEWADDHTLSKLEVVVGSLGPKPRRIAKLDAIAAGRQLDAELIEQVAQLAGHQCHPLDNISAAPDWRRKVVPVHVARAMAALTPNG